MAIDLDIPVSAHPVRVTCPHCGNVTTAPIDDLPETCRECLRPLSEGDEQ